MYVCACTPPGVMSPCVCVHVHPRRVKTLRWAWRFSGGGEPDGTRRDPAGPGWCVPAQVEPGEGAVLSSRPDRGTLAGGRHPDRVGCPGGLHRPGCVRFPAGSSALWFVKWGSVSDKGSCVSQVSDKGGPGRCAEFLNNFRVLEKK